MLFAFAAPRQRATASLRRAASRFENPAHRPPSTYAVASMLPDIFCETASHLFGEPIAACFFLKLAARTSKVPAPARSPPATPRAAAAPVNRDIKRRVPAGRTVRAPQRTNPRIAGSPAPVAALT